MLRSRIIPCLLIQDDELVKTKGLEDPKYVRPNKRGENLQ